MSSKIAFEVEIKNVSEVSKLKDELKKLRKEQKNIEKQTVETGKASKKNAEQYTKTAKTIGDKSKRLRELNKRLREGADATKKATKSSNGLAKQFLKASAAIGIVVGAFRAVNGAVSSVIKTFTEFEFTMAKVQAVSGATGKEFDRLSETAQELGRTTFFTAQQVASLQLAYSKLGFSTQEILDAQDATLQLATATGTDLERAAQVAGATVRGFGLAASETQRVVDVMAVAFSSSALDIEKWSTGMTKVAPIAKAAGFSIEDTSAIMAQLSDAGIEASIAGTSLRNILLKMQDPTSELSQAFGGTIHSLDELVPAMKKFVEEGGDMAEILEVVDLRQAAAFEQMLTSADKTLELRNKLNEANGEARRMAEIIGDTLQGAFLKVTSALQGLSIAVIKDFAGGMQRGLEKAAQFFNMLAENSETITKIIKGITFLTKAIIASRIAFAAKTAVVNIARKSVVLYGAATGTATMATKRFIVSLRTLRGAIARTGVGVLVVLLGDLAAKFLLASDNSDDLNDNLEDTLDLQQRIQKIADDTNSIMNNMFADTEAGATKAIQKIKDEIAERKKKLDQSKINLGQFVQNIDILDEKERKAYEESIKRLNTRLGLEERNLREIRKRKAKEKALENDLITIQKKKLENANAEAATTEEALIAKNKKIKAIEKEIKRLQELGVEEDAKDDRDVKAIQHAQDYVDIYQGVIDGTKTLADANQELREKEIERLQTEVDALPQTEEFYDKRILLEAKLMEMKTKNAKKTEDSVDKELKAQRKLIKEYSKLGSALQTIAGDNEKLNKIRAIGEGITKAAAVAEALLTLQTQLNTLKEEENMIATLLGIKTKQAKIATDTIATATTTADTVATGVSTVTTTADTVATGANTVATGVNAGVEAASIPVKVASGAASQAKLPFPLNIIAIVATLAILSRIMKMFEKGGIIDSKYARGGMVHGRSHAQGGEKFAVGGRVVELEGGEAVINKRSTAMFRGQLSAMNEAGGGVKFADGGLLNMPKFTQQRFSGANIQSPSQKVYVVESDITNTQQTVASLEAQATI